MRIFEDPLDVADAGPCSILSHVLWQVNGSEQLSGAFVAQHALQHLISSRWQLVLLQISIERPQCVPAQQPLMPAAQEAAVGALRSDRKLAFRCAPSPEALPALVMHNLAVAVELLLRLLPSPKARSRIGARV